MLVSLLNCNKGCKILFSIVKKAVKNIFFLTKITNKKKAVARSGACTVKLFTVVNNSISQRDNVFATVQGILMGEVSLYC
jgi:hypothetical protein